MLPQCRSEIRQSIGNYSGYLEHQTFKDIINNKLNKQLTFQEKSHNNLNNYITRRLVYKKTQATKKSIVEQLNFKYRQSSDPYSSKLNRNLNISEDIDPFIRRKSSMGEIFGQCAKEKSLLSKVKYEIAQHRRHRLEQILKNIVIQKQEDVTPTQIDQIVNFSSTFQNMNQHMKNFKIRQQSSGGARLKQSTESTPTSEDMERVRRDLEAFKVGIERTSHFHKQSATSINLETETERALSFECLPQIRQKGRKLTQTLGNRKLIPTKISSLRMMQINQPLFSLNITSQKKISSSCTSIQMLPKYTNGQSVTNIPKNLNDSINYTSTPKNKSYFSQSKQEQIYKRPLRGSLLQMKNQKKQIDLNDQMIDIYQDIIQQRIVSEPYALSDRAFKIKK